MHVERQKDRLVFTFNFLEGTLVRRALNEIIQNYKMKPDEVDPKVAAVWYSTRGCRSAKMTPEEVQEWLNTLHAYKSACLPLLKECQRELARRHSGHYRLSVTLEAAPSLMTILNDHRLLVAARNDIGQAEMDLHVFEQFARLKPEQQAAMFSIHLLACMIEEIIRLIDPEAASWHSEGFSP